MTKRTAHVKRTAVILGKGRYADELNGRADDDGPQPEFIAIARSAGAEIISYTAAAARRGGMFGKAFARVPILGSIADFTLRSSQFDSCYVTGEDIGLRLALALKLIGWKGRLVCVVHNVTPKKARLFRLIGHRTFAALIVVSERQRRALREECAIPDEKIVHEYNWVDTDFFSPGDITSDETGPIVMACGAENRDYATLARSAASVPATFHIYYHGFFGAGESSNATLPENIVRMPRVPFPALRDGYRAAAAVAIPLNNVEYAAGVSGFVEAMACGRPVVVTNTKGIADYLGIIDAEFRVLPADADDMARALNAALSKNDAERDAIGQRNRDWAIANCSLDAYARRVADLLAGVSSATR